MAILKHNVLHQENDNEHEGKYKVQHCWGFVLPFVPSTTQHPNLRDSLFDVGEALYNPFYGYGAEEDTWGAMQDFKYVVHFIIFESKQISTW